MTKKSEYEQQISALYYCWVRFGYQHETTAGYLPGLFQLLPDRVSTETFKTAIKDLQEAGNG